LPDITRDFKARGVDLSHFYRHLDVPLDLSEQHILSEAYRAYARDYSNAMGIAVSVETLEQIVKAKVGPWTDFAALDRQTQMDWVERVVADPALATQIRRHNHLDRLWRVSSEQVQYNRQQIHQHYGLSAYGSTLMTLYQQIAEDQSETDLPPSLDNPMLQHFFHPDHLQLLRR
jgi:hypothetical protein